MDKNLKIEYYPKIDKDLLQESISKIQLNKDKWNSPFFFDTKSYVDIELVKESSSPYLLNRIQNIIVLGTGGSIQTFLALRHLSKKRIFPITSSRSVELQECLDKTSPDNSVVIPISRGGETLDINSTIGTFLSKDYKFLGLSSMGTMNELLKNIGSPILDVPDLSGRYAGSVTNVGIVPSYISGVNIESFLKGLSLGYSIFSDYKENIALEFAAYLYNLYKKNFKVIFSMPYSKNIEGCVGLWIQGISEGTGKDGKGMIGTCQSAPICQHSVLEYLLGGFKGNVIPILWTIEEDIPDLFLKSSINYVNEKTAQTVVNYQADATFQALIQQGVPSAKISIINPLEINIGYLIAFILSTVYYLCLLIDVNWATNPKVIIGKKICNEALQENFDSEKRIRIRESIANSKFENFF
ncbi:MAG: Glucose-6-phosphate isomerase [Candidatus Lokiarchaeum sp. GC14_75]|nr:MAG: Glucose-6-phosphate isomerase [Candidatus Lokiarchaeum sp. GC14_75]